MPSLRLSERGKEMAFGIGLLLVVGLPLAAAELLARRYVAATRAPQVEWRRMIDAAGFLDGGLARFKPGMRYGKLVFNERGLRGPSLPVPAPARTIRIAFVGDSKVLSADVPEPQTLGAQTARRLQAAVPGCRFDYASIAGPGYTASFLARLWPEHAPVLRPDLAVVLAGAPEELLRAVDAGASPRPDPAAARAQAAGGSVFLKLVGRELRLVSPAAAFNRRNDLPPPMLAAGYRRMTGGLVRAIGNTPTIAIAYRSRLRAGQTAQQRRFATRKLREDVPGLSVAGAVALSDAVIANLDAVAQNAGWQFMDPIAAIPPDRRHFVDMTHFTAVGLAPIADALAARIVPAIDADCRLRFPARTRQPAAAP